MLAILCREGGEQGREGGEQGREAVVLARREPMHRGVAQVQRWQRERLELTLLMPPPYRRFSPTRFF